MQPTENSSNLRPPTPSGFMSESDPDLELRHRLSPLAPSEEELPHTPGGGLEIEAEIPALSPAPPTPLPTPRSPTGLLHFPSPPIYFSPPPLLSSYPAYEEIPKTPGRNSKHEHISRRVTTAKNSQDAFLRVTMHGSFSPAFASSSPNGVPRTPGRDIAPSSPLSDHTDKNVHPREQSCGQNPGWSSRYSSCFSGSSSSESPSPRSPNLVTEQDFAQRRLDFSTNLPKNLDAAHLKKRRERLQHKRRMILLQKSRLNRNVDAFPFTPAGDLISKSSYDETPGFNGELHGQAFAQVKKPLQVRMDNMTKIVPS